ncbi:TonB-dependent receptor [Membranihabitans maritimus]|uniref:TonB-dependent receptor n=1 Tax=Membranihabitans maritimus TaxID=2904244 RepID=UPI001F211ADF|nr:carboxypeptidase-like regulatory domain-containing protein [Membranihabitans maritimus]
MKLYPVILLVLLTLPLMGQTEKSLKGVVKDASNEKPLEAVSIFCKECANGTYTDSLGRFEIPINNQISVHIKFSYVGYKSRSILIKEGTDNLNLTISLQEEVSTLKEVVVTNDSEKDRLLAADLGSEQLSANEIKELPSILGESDVLKTFQLKPGILSGSEGNSTLFIRGGKGDQNLVLLDGIPIYNPNHLLGFLSTFNSSVLQSAKLYKAGFPSNYGGRISSVIDIKTRPGNDKGIHASGGVGLISADLTIEAPLKKNHTSLLISGRRTHIDYLSGVIEDNFDIGNSLQEIPDYHFYDFNFKLKSQLSDNDRLEVNGYTGRDDFKTLYEVHDIDVDWGNSLGSLIWNHKFTDRLFLNTTVSYSEFSHNLNNRIDEFDFVLGSKILNTGSKMDLTYQPRHNQLVKVGVNYSMYKFDIGRLQVDNQGGEVEFSSGEKPQVQELAAYIANDYEIKDRFHIVSGVRFSGFINKTNRFFSIEPRIGASFVVNTNFSIKSAYTRMTQYIHQVSNSGLSLPTDIWYPSNENIAPQYSDQISVGWNYQLNDQFLLTHELYYKSLENQIEFKNHSIIFASNQLDDKFTFGRGDAFGTELYLEKRSGKLTGWIGYTLAKVQRGKFDGISGGNYFPPRHDRRHDLSIVASFAFNKKWSLSSTFVFGSGDKTWLPTGRFHFQDMPGKNSTPVVPVYEDRNSVSLPDYHRLDASIVRKFFTEWGDHEIIVGVYNAYNRKNPYFLYLDTQYHIDENGKENKELPVNSSIKQVSLFPILPSFRWNFKF